MMIAAMALAACTGAAPDPETDSDSPGPADTADTADTGVDGNAGTFDLGFSGDGLLTTDAGFDDRGRAVAAQADGRILVAGKSHDDYLIVRYLEDGSLDAGFGANGLVFTDIGSSYDEGKSFALQDDGRIVLAGISTIGDNANFSVARYLANGSPDPSFGEGGVAVGGFGDATDEGKSVAVQADGSLILAGQTFDGGDRDFALIRFDASGQPDPSFGDAGRLATDLGGFDDEANAVRVQPDGQIVVAGYSSDGVAEDFAVARYSPDGTLDASFGSGGIVTTAVGDGRDIAFAAALLADGRIVLAGIRFDGARNDFAAVRYLEDGSLDASFGDGGSVTVSIGANSECTAVAVQGDGRIVLAGTTSDDDDSDFTLVRLAEDGSLDASFGAEGLAILPVAGADDGAYAMAIQGDGQILVAGEAGGGGGHDLALVRVHD